MEVSPRPKITSETEPKERNVHWTPRLETIIAREAEKCRGLAWIHQHSEQHQNLRNNGVQIPVMVLSTLVGTASVGSGVFQCSPTSTLVIGLVSLGVGILSTLGNYFSYAKKTEAHRVAYLQYNRVFSDIQVELALPHTERLAPMDLLRGLRKDMKHLAETAPSPPSIIIQEFCKEFDMITNIAKPMETNGLEKIDVYSDTETTISIETQTSAMMVKTDLSPKPQVPV